MLRLGEFAPKHLERWTTEQGLLSISVFKVHAEFEQPKLRIDVD